MDKIMKPIKLTTLLPIILFSLLSLPAMEIERFVRFEFEHIGRLQYDIHSDI